LLICHWINRCYKTLSKKSSEASPEEGAGLRYDQQLQGVNTAGVSGSSNPPFGFLLSTSPTGRPGD